MPNPTPSSSSTNYTLRVLNNDEEMNDDISSSIIAETDSTSKIAVDAIATTLFARTGSKAPPLLEHSISTLSALTDMPAHVNSNLAMRKPSFQNRRRSSEYLKHSFPAGFRLNEVRAELTNDPYEHILRRANHIHTEVKTKPKGVCSFVNFSMQDSSFGAENDDLHDDPFADCAGPSLAELQKARMGLKECSFDYVGNDPACIVSKAPVARKQTLNGSPPNHVHNGVQFRTKIYHAPAILPTLAPSLNGTSSFVLNHQAGKGKPIPAEYEKWLSGRQQRADEQSWRKKGNDVTHNYSAYGFGGENASPRTLKVSVSAPSLNYIPQPWKPEICLEIYTMKQIMKAVRSDEHSQQFMLKVLSSEALLKDIRLSIAHDIIEGIKSAFPDLPVLLNSPNYNLVPVQIENIDMVFTYYHEELHCWRPLQNEADWVECKNLSTCRGSRIKIMYGLEAHSEKLLVDQIQRNYELQRDLLAKKKPPISVEDLTDALAVESKRKNKKIPSEQKLKRSVSLKTTPEKEKNTIFSTDKSVLYPKSSAALKELQSQSLISHQRLETFAANLEGKILKTRW